MNGDAEKVLGSLPAAKAERLRRAMAESRGPDAEEEMLIMAFLDGVPARHHASIRARLLRTDGRVSAQSTDVEGQKILDLIYLRRLRQDDNVRL